MQLSCIFTIEHELKNAMYPTNLHGKYPFAVFRSSALNGKQRHIKISKNKPQRVAQYCNARCIFWRIFKISKFIFFETNGRSKKSEDYCARQIKHLILGCDDKAHDPAWGSSTSLVKYLISANLEIPNKGSAFYGVEVDGWLSGGRRKAVLGCEIFLPFKSLLYYNAAWNF